MSPSPNGSFSIRLDDVNEETDQENRHQLTRRENMHRDIGEDSGDNAGTIEVDVTAKDKNEIGKFYFEFSFECVLLAHVRC